MRKKSRFIVRPGLSMTDFSGTPAAEKRKQDKNTASKEVSRIRETDRDYRSGRREAMGDGGTRIKPIRYD